VRTRNGQRIRRRRASLKCGSQLQRPGQTIRQIRLGTVEAPDAATAIEKAAVEYKVPANRLMAAWR
jgi:hypothetical protein